ncbi:MAG: hypothetical protein M1829_003820 [Trizodia sp. TS-e1964]|nr:MAG: hypothetical protein M1829_003820 [Trizodia sp. TS-e1964]
MHALLFLGGLLVAPALSVPTPVDMRSEGFFKGVMNLVFPPDNADAPPPPESDAKRFFFLPAGGDGSSQAFTLPSDSESYIKRIVNSGSIPEYMVQGLDLAHWQSPPDAPPEGTIIGYLIAVPSGDSKESTEEVFRKEKSKKGVPIISYYAYGDEEDNGQTRKIHKKSFPYYRSSEQRDKDLWACSKRIGKCGDTCGCNKHQNDLAEIYRRDGGQDDTMVRSSSNFHRTGDSSSSNSENSHEAHRSENNKDEKTHKVTKEQDASGDSRANERNSDNRHSDSNENNSDGHSDRSSQASTEERRKSSDYQDGDTRKTKEETSRVSGSNSEDNSSNKVNKSQRESNNRVDEVKSQNVRAGED